MKTIQVNPIYQAPPYTGTVTLGKTLPELLDEACDRTPNDQAFHQWTDAGWRPLSNQTFRETAAAIAVGLSTLGLQKGDRIAFLMHSDVNFCIADMATLIGSWIDVPIDLTQTLENILFVLRHSEAKGLILSNLDLLAQVAPYLRDAYQLEFVIVAEVPLDWEETRSQWMTNLSNPTPHDSSGHSPIQVDSEEIPENTCLSIPHFLSQTRLTHPCRALPQCIQVFSLAEMQQRGQIQGDALQPSRPQPQDVATLIYIPDESGQLQGVMLTHENLSANALAAFSGIEALQPGEEVVLSFLPLNHVFARSMLYGHIHQGHCIYFSNPSRVIKHLRDVRPTLFSTVPLFLEKIYSKIIEKGDQLPSRSQRTLFRWALGLAQRYQIGQPTSALETLQLQLADRWVFVQWRSLFGGRMKYVLSGGAALKAEIVNGFAAAGITIFQGYGLTQTSSVICHNRGQFNRAGTVGIPMAGVDMTLADDGEILIRAPYITPGYYKNPAATRELIDAQGWLRTGDLGYFSEDGFLTITGIKKALFKLSTGKYIAPRPLEHQLQQSPLISHAVVVGLERKFCALLIFPHRETLLQQAEELGLQGSLADILHHPCIVTLYQTLVDAANCHLPYWAMVKRFTLVNTTLEEEFVSTPMNRSLIVTAFASEIEAMYHEGRVKGEQSAGKSASKEGLAIASPIISCSIAPAPTCPTFAQSLNPRLTT